MNLSLYLILCGLCLIGGIFQIFTHIKKQKNIEERKQDWLKFIVYCVIINTLALCIWKFPHAFPVLCSSIVLAGFVEFIFLYKKLGKPRFLAILCIYACLGFTFVQFSYFNSSILYFTLLVTCVFDAFSQLSGKLFGKHKMFPKISPNKTYEGALGGIIAAVSIACILSMLTGRNIYESLFYGFGIAVFAFLGDFSASYLKRQAGIKDFSRILPGNGGFLDRFDSLLFASAFIYACKMLAPHINTEMLFCIVYLLFILGVLLFCEYLHRKQNMDVEYTRKIAHTISATSTLSFLFLFTSPVYVIIIIVSAFLCLFISHQKKVLKSIEDINRNTYGSFMMPLGVIAAYFSMLYLHRQEVYYTAILILAVSDPLACIIGKNNKSLKLIHNKTLWGTAAFLLSAFLISICVLSNFEYNTLKILVYSASIALGASLAEIFFSKGFDNLTIPVSIFIVFLCLHNL